MAIRLVQLGDLDGLVISGARTTGALLLCDSDDELRELGGLLMAPVRVVAAGSADDDGDGDGESKRLVVAGGEVVKSSYGFIGPGPGRRGRKTGALEVVLQRALAVLQRDTSVVWRSTDLLRSAGGTTSGTWSRVCARLAKHPDVTVSGSSYTRRYQARRA